MSGEVDKRPAMSGTDEELRQYEPIYSGPPEKPEYYMLYKKNGARELTGLKINNFIIEDKAREERHEALSQFRKEYYIRQFPGKIRALGDVSDPLITCAGFPIPPEYMPTFDVYKKDVPPKKPIVLVNLPVRFTHAQHTFSVEWREIIEEVAHGDCQFFPYEFRLRDGSVIRTRYIIRCLAPDVEMPFSPKKSGFKRERWTDGSRAGEYHWYKGGSGFQLKLYAGQLVLSRSTVRGRNIVYSSSQYFVSAQLYERLKAHCGRHYAFYPLHIDEEC